ncbi:hypothetical protein BH09ACT12_BH09ACT12_07420 [soil metagenome]
MSGLATIVILAVAALSLVCIAAGLTHGVRRSALTAVGTALVLVGAAGLVVGDLVPRHLADSAGQSACGGALGPVRISSSPLAWQVLTGGILAEVDVSEDKVTDAVQKRLADTPLSDASVALLTDELQVSGNVDSRFGTLVVQLDLAPSVEDGRLAMTATTVTVNGRSLPPALMDQLALGPEASGDQVEIPGCGAGNGNTDVELTDVRVGPTGLVVSARV